LVAFSPNNRYIAFTATDDKPNTFIKVYDVQLDKQVSDLRMEGQTPQLLRFAPDSSLLLSGDDDGKIRAWDLQRGSAARIYTIGQYGIFDLDYRPDGTRLAVFSPDGLFLLTADTGRVIYQANIDDIGWGSTVRFSPDGQLLAAGLGLFDASTGQA